MGCGGRSHKLGFLLSLQWVIGVVLQIWRWSHGGYDRRRLADLEVVSRWCSFAVVQLAWAWVRNKLRGGAGLRRSEAEWLPVGLAVGQDVVAGGCVAVNGG
uniref:Uncharacterized protein n=1 Tax=Fagus sylvatica TaxID=28930 RepID=A0A2N9HSY9_FAGSY